MSNPSPKDDGSRVGLGEPEGEREDERLAFCPEVSDEEQGLEDERLALGLVLSVEDEFFRVATSLAEATTKLPEAKPKLREAVDGAV